MRVALLSTLDDAVTPAPVRAAYRNFAGARIIDRQIDLALAAGCETIACLVEGIGREVAEAQRRAEQSGVRFVAMQNPRALSGLVTAADELFVLAPGVLPSDAAVLRNIARPAVLAFPAEDAVPRGYERIDPEFAWSGALLAPGSVVERLAELPPDSDVVASLLRLSLQSGVKVLPLEKRLIEDGQWHIDPSIEDLVDREERWIKTHSSPAPFTAPGLAVAERVGARLARDTLGKKGARLPALGAVLSGIGALALAALGMPVPALAFGTVMAVLGAAGETVERIARAGQFGARRSALAKALDWSTDPVLAILIAAASPEDTGWLRLFVPAVLFGLLRLGARLRDDNWGETYRDRIAVSALLVPCAFLGITQPVTAIMALLVLISLFLVPHRGD